MSTSDLTPTVVLVHGAFVDASSWNGIIAELKAAGLDCSGAAEPAARRRRRRRLPHRLRRGARPPGHPGRPLLRRRCHQPDRQRREQRHRARVRGRLRPRGGRDARGDQRPLPQRAAGGRATHLHVHRRTRRAGDRHVRRRRVVPRRGVRRGARGRGRHAGAQQRPASLDAFTTAVTGTPAWKTLPSWAIVATADHAIHPDAERDMAKRARSEITEIDASHAVPATHPADVAAVMVRAVKAIR